MAMEFDGKTYGASGHLVHPGAPLKTEKAPAPTPEPAKATKEKKS